MRQARHGSVGTLLLAATALLQTSWAHAQGAPAAAPKADTAPKSDAAPKADAAPKSDAASKTETAPAVEGDSKAEASAASETSGSASSAPPAKSAESPTSGAPAQPSPISNTPGTDSTQFGIYSPTEEAKQQDATEKPKDASEKSQSVFAEDWWGHTRPTLELHGNFRVRANLFHQFALGRIDPPDNALWPRPEDDYYTDTSGNTHGAQVCTPAEAGQVATGTSNSAGSTNNPPTGTITGRSPGDANRGCSNQLQAGANLRFRIEPTIIISDNLRIRSQIDLFDNLVMGSTPEGYQNTVGTGGYQVSSSPTNLEASSQNPPVSGVNSLSDAIVVRRAWAEYETPVGQARFGRMPDHWGLGIHHNGGDGIDADYQTTVDRIAFVTGLPSLSLYAAGAWDFAKEGATSSGYRTNQYPAYDVAQFDDVSSMNLQLFRKTDPQLEKLALARGDLVVNGGLYLTYRFQRIDASYTGADATCGTGSTLGCTAGQYASTYTRRGLDVWTPDLYAEVKYKKFRTGVEVVTHQGSIDNLATKPGDNDYTTTTTKTGYRVNQWGLAGEITQYLVEDKLKLGLFFGYASGDADTDGVRGLLSDAQLGDATLSTFRFNPAYRVDFILNRHILRQVSGVYYIKPMAQYDFLRDASGLRLGGRAEAIWTRASQFMQTPGHGTDLGVELDGSVYYQSKDGVLNDDPSQLGGFFAMLNYAVFFPMNALGYQQVAVTNGTAPGLETAQALRLFLGVAY